jgi:hypothetical protein
MDRRKFLKHFGIGAQPELEKILQQGFASGSIQPRSVIHARARLAADGRQVDRLVAQQLRFAQ